MSHGPGVWGRCDCCRLVALLSPALTPGGRSVLSVCLGCEAHPLPCFSRGAVR